MRTYLTFCFLLLVLWAKAAEIPVTPGTFTDAYNTATDGDILLLETGDYTARMQFPSGKTITLKAAQGSSPVLKGDIQSSADCTNGGLIFDGVTIDRGNSNFIDITLLNVNIIAFRNTTIKNINRCLLITSGTGTIGEIEFDNCIITDCGSGGYNLMWSNHAVQKLTVKNSTLYNYTGESFLAPRAEYSDNVLTFLFENNTVYKWSKASEYAIVRADNSAYSKAYSSSSTYTFRNNIFNEPGVNGQEPKLLSITAGTVTADNNLIVNYGGYSGGTQTINDLTLEGLGLNKIGFTDPANGDFTLLSTSPLATAGTNGTCLGAPSWIKTVQQPVNLTTTVFPEGAGTASPIVGTYDKDEWVVLRASHNHGFRFKEWQKGGKTLSTENPFQLQMTEDMDITAVFDVLDTYTLTINKEGDGAKWANIRLNPEPVNGKYEKGDVVTVNIIPNDATSFLYWEDNQSTDISRQIQMNEDITLAAHFDVIPFIVGWSFDPSEPRNNRVADFYYRTDNMGVMKFFNADGSTTNWGGSSKTYNGITYPAARRYTGAADMNTPRYFQAEFSVKGYENTSYKDIKISSYIAIDNECAHKKQKMLYATSPDGPFHELATLDMTPYYDNQWVEFSATLPELTEAEKERIYIRWIGDTNSELFGTPGSGATEGFYLANVFVFATEVVGDDFEAPALLTTIPAEGSSTASANGSFVLTFNERVKAGLNNGQVEFNGETLTPVFANRTVTYAYRNLSYDTDYTFTLPAGVITDMADNDFAGTDIHFKTNSRQPAIKRLFDAIVDQNGNGDYTSIQDAIDAAPENRATPWLIFIRNGYYEELVRIPESKSYIHLIGQDVEHVTVTFRIHCGTGPNSGGELGVNDCSTIVISAPDFYAENISFENKHGVEALDGPQAYAVFTNNDRHTFYNCKFRSYQDTWKTSTRKNNSDRTYMTQSRVEGAVDYIFGGGNLYVEQTTLYFVGGGYLVAPSHGTSTPWGYVFNNCTIDSKEGVKNISLGRPWQNEPQAVFLNTIMKVLPHAERWSGWYVTPRLFAEYNSMDVDNNPLDMSGTIGSILTDEEAARYSYENVIAGTDNWNPRTYFEAAEKPINPTISVDGTLTWDDNKYALNYIVYRDREIIGFTESNSFNTGSVAGEYRIQSVNEYGSLGEISNVATGGTSVEENVETAKPTAWIKNGELRIENIQENAKISIYTVDGYLLENSLAETHNITIPFRYAKGIYIVKMDEYSCKVVY